MKMIEAGSQLFFKYGEKRVFGTVDSIKVVDGKRIAPENRGKQLVRVKLENGEYRSYYAHKMIPLHKSQGSAS